MAPILNEVIKKLNLATENQTRIIEQNANIQSALTDMFEFFGMGGSDD